MEKIFLSKFPTTERNSEFEKINFAQVKIFGEKF